MPAAVLGAPGTPGVPARYRADIRGDEARVVDAFCSWLATNGWEVEREVEFCDVLARRGDEVIYAEAKGKTASVGLDLDTMYGQLLRRMPASEVGVAQFAVVVPTSALSAALRVPARVRELLGIEIYAVDDRGGVEHHHGQGEPPNR